MDISIVFWNIWLENQIGARNKSDKLYHELDYIIRTRNPAVIGLNEVMLKVGSNQPEVISYLEGLGYKYNYYEAGSLITKDWQIGSAITSKLPIKKSFAVPLSRDTNTPSKGLGEHTLKALHAELELDSGKPLNLVVAHPIYPSLRTIRDHYAGIRSLVEFLNSGKIEGNIIIGGDFNEAKIWPRSFYSRVKRDFHRRTGTLTNPTWRLLGKKPAPIRANLDHIYWAKSSNLQLKTFAVLNVGASDHKPVYAKFIIK